MAITVAAETDRVISLEEYIDHVSSHVDVFDMKSLEASAPWLKALANNRRFLTERLNQELMSWRTFQPANAYTAQTFILGKGDGFFIRANIWIPPSRDPGIREWQDKIYVYLMPHDHNFSFMTIGYLGSGYETTIYEYDSEQVHGVPGERVDLRFLERTSLPEGKIMLYRASKDIHSQEHPTEFSISLNLMVASPTFTNVEQYLFDLESGTISDYIKVGVSTRVMLCEMARYIGDGNTAEALSALSQRHACKRTRLTAYESLAALEPGSAHKIWQPALKDPSPYVRKIAGARLEAS